MTTVIEILVLFCIWYLGFMVGSSRERARGGRVKLVRGQSTAVTVGEPCAGEHDLSEWRIISCRNCGYVLIDADDEWRNQRVQ